MIKYVIHAKKWHDKVNGNTYHAARVLDTQAQLQLKVPFQYGYGDQFVSSSSNEMIKQNWIKEKLKGLDAVVLQHEVDHLNGILFIDRADKITQGQEILDSLKKQLDEQTK